MVGFVRRFYLPILLVLTFVVPYLALGESSGQWRERLGGLFASRGEDMAPVEGIDDPEVGRLLAIGQELTAQQPDTQTLAGLTPTVSLQGALRFDVTPQWVMQHWPHVSTTRTDGPLDATLDGLRVALVTGTGPHDIVGSLTYYFDAQQQVQRISIDGVMGDDRQLVAFVTQYYQLKSEPHAGVGIYSTKWNGERISALWVRRMPVVHSRSGAQQYEFALELNRPSSYHGLSTRMEQRLQHAHAQGLPGTLAR